MSPWILETRVDETYAKEENNALLLKAGCRSISFLLGKGMRKNYMKQKQLLQAHSCFNIHERMSFQHKKVD